jgi:hypothetical protein
MQFVSYTVILYYQSPEARIAQSVGYGLDGRGIGVRFLAGQEIPPLFRVRTGSGAQPLSHTIGYRGYFPVRKVAGA